jgi:hypothetical protein
LLGDEAKTNPQILEHSFSTSYIRSSLSQYQVGLEEENKENPPECLVAFQKLWRGSKLLVLPTTTIF